MDQVRKVREADAPPGAGRHLAPRARATVESELPRSDSASATLRDAAANARVRRSTSSTSEQAAARKELDAAARRARRRARPRARAQRQDAARDVDPGTLRRATTACARGVARTSVFALRGVSCSHCDTARARRSVARRSPPAARSDVCESCGVLLYAARRDRGAAAPPRRDAGTAASARACSPLRRGLDCRS